MNKKELGELLKEISICLLNDDDVSKTIESLKFENELYKSSYIKIITYLLFVMTNNNTDKYFGKDKEYGLKSLTKAILNADIYKFSDFWKLDVNDTNDSLVKLENYILDEVKNKMVVDAWNNSKPTVN